jgi:hypothetical protein
MKTDGSTEHLTGRRITAPILCMHLLDCVQDFLAADHESESMRLPQERSTSQVGCRRRAPNEEPSSTDTPLA